MYFLEDDKNVKPEVNIGLVGHVDHGKTTLTQVLTGKWADTHSEEVKRGITIRLGYADAVFYYCESCKRYFSGHQIVGQKCECSYPLKLKRSVSFVDAPGHETLMATVLSGASLMDGAILVIAADEPCPQPQTAEHLKALDIAGIKNIVIAQNKIEIVSKEEAIEHHNQIKAFVKDTVAENAPVVPISAVHNVNIDSLIESIEEYIPTPKRNPEAEPKFFIARSFDINKPGTEISKLSGGVVGGSLVQGMLKTGDEIEIKPGVQVKDKWQPLKSKIVEIVQAGTREEASPGGLVALKTGLDPSLTKNDSLSGNVMGLIGKLPPVNDRLKMKVETFDHVIGVEGFQRVEPIKTGSMLMLTVGIAKTVGIVESVKAGKIDTKLRMPVVADKGDKVSISSQLGGRWHLIGWGLIL
ncbi:MAG: translation initiation factor IF-2 subunit gamma [Candidatus Aenigmatarchaeota archaeon]